MNKTILIVEDNEMNRILVKDLLESENYDTVIAKDSEEALYQARNSAPDLILMDIGLPEKDGIEVTKQIKNIDSISDELPIIALTAHATQKDRKRIKKSGVFFDLITKPINTKEFLVKINKIIEGKENGIK